MDPDELRMMDGYSCIILKQLLAKEGWEFRSRQVLAQNVFQIVDAMMVERNKRFEAAAPDRRETNVAIQP